MKSFLQFYQEMNQPTGQGVAPSVPPPDQALLQIQQLVGKIQDPRTKQALENAFKSLGQQQPVQPAQVQQPQVQPAQVQQPAQAQPKAAGQV